MVGELVNQFLHKSNIDVLLVQDPPRTWLLQHSIGRFNLFCSAKVDSLTAILVNCFWQASLVPVGGARVSVVEVGQGRESIFFFSGYVQPNTGVGCAEIGRALRAIGGGHRKCLGMDGNGHSQVWGPSSVITNPQGVLLENLLASEEMISINAPDSAPTYTGDDGRHSWIAVSAVFVELLH